MNNVKSNIAAFCNCYVFKYSFVIFILDHYKINHTENLYS